MLLMNRIRGLAKTAFQLNPIAAVKRPSNVSPLSCEPPAGGGGRLDEIIQSRALLVNCSGWLDRIDSGRTLIAKSDTVQRQLREITSEILRCKTRVNPFGQFRLMSEESAAAATIHPFPEFWIHLQVKFGVVRLSDHAV